MFHARNWAEAFIGVLNDKAESGIVHLKNFSALLKPIRGVLFGSSIAESIEAMLIKEFVEQKDLSLSIIEEEYSIRFICLLIEKNLFSRIDVIIEKIEMMIDEKNGVINIALETASREDNTFEDELKKMIREETGASKIKMKMSVVPELLAGYRLIMNGQFIDASLKGQLEQMSAELKTM